MNRLIGTLAFVCMLSANLQLILRDFWPVWTAGAPPVLEREVIPSDEPWRHQAAVLVRGERVGTAWTEARRLVDQRYVVATLMRLSVIETGNDILTPELLIESSFIYFRDGRLESLSLQVVGFGQLIQLHGRFVPPGDFPCEWQIGDRRGTFVLPAAGTRSMGDQFQPFRRLGRLSVGQSWRVKVIDPLAGSLASFTGGGLETRDLTVQVVDKTSLEHGGEMVRVYELRAGENVRAWINDDGEPLRQEIRMPLIGLIEIVAEPFDFQQREESRYRSLSVVGG